MSWPSVSLTASWLFLAGSLWGAWFTWNAYRPIASRPRLSVLSFFAGWLTTELAIHHIAWQAVLTVGFIWLGALSHWPGLVGLVVTLASWLGLAGCLRTAWGADEAIERGLRDGLGAGYGQQIAPALEPAMLTPRVDWRQILLPFPIRHSNVERTRNIRYARAAGQNLLLDVYRSRTHPTGCPVLLQVHGGGWVLGSKNEQGLPLMRHLTQRGWVCVSADYRLSPGATFPDHLVDLKRAIAWIREHIGEYGGDPDQLVVTGGSAGGHLASLVALTANDPRYQPGFESVDTSVVACVSFYGVYDFTNRFGVWRHGGLRDVLERQVMKASLDEAPEAYEEASPVSRVNPDAPPFFVIHGSHDTLVPVEEARRFCEALRRTARVPVVYAEIPGAQHAFEIFPSLRTTFVLYGVERFLAWVMTQRRAALPAARDRDAPAA
jgi:acetyl esterase/lipase